MSGTSILWQSWISRQKEMGGLTSRIDPPSRDENAQRVDHCFTVAIPVLLRQIHRVTDLRAVGFQEYVAGAVRDEDPIRVELEHPLSFHREDRVLVAAVGLLIEEREIGNT